MEGFTTRTITNLPEFTQLIEETIVDQALYLFRGQAEDWPLLPALARGSRTQGTPRETEQWMLEEFQRHSLPYLRVTPSTLWDWLALAQHHGLPTRLIDWSLNPLTSLWFAVHRPAVEHRPGVLWILQPSWGDVAEEDEKNSLECERHRVFAPKNVTERITAQVGWFTVHDVAAEEPYFEPLEESTDFASKLTKIIIPADSFAHLRFQLSNLGVHNFSIFPGLDGLGAYIKWQGYYFLDELPGEE
jgi:hypothetical protein